MKLDEPLRARLTRYVCDVFSPEDDVLRELVPAALAAGLPEIQISPDVGRLLQILARAVGARRVLEIGTLGGYSGIWLARALPPGGRLVTCEIEPRHAEFARGQFARAGLAERVEVRLGPAIDTLGALTREEPFDLAFIDADKQSYPLYLEAALRLVRPGGIIAADNVLHMTSWPTPIFDADTADPNVRAMRAFNERLASDPRLLSTIVPVRDGVAVAFVRPEGPAAR